MIWNVWKAKNLVTLEGEDLEKYGFKLWLHEVYGFVRGRGLGTLISYFSTRFKKVMTYSLSLTNEWNLKHK